MIVCHLCGEEKPDGEFRFFTNFTRYKRHVQWCRDCQKMYLERKYEKDRKKKLLILEPNFIVTFEWRGYMIFVFINGFTLKDAIAGHWSLGIVNYL